MKSVFSVLLFLALLTLFLGFGGIIKNCSSLGAEKACSPSTIHLLSLFLGICTAILAIGIYVLLFSPFVLEMDKEKDICIKKKKYLWQKQYQVKALCKLSEIKNAECFSVFGYNQLYFRLHNFKKVVVLWCYDLALIQQFPFGINRFEMPVVEINSFLRNTKSSSRSLSFSLVEAGLFLVVTALILLFLALVYMLGIYA